MSSCGGHPNRRESTPGMTDELDKSCWIGTFSLVSRYNDKDRLTGLGADIPILAGRENGQGQG